jgi:hypothetical protein
MVPKFTATVQENQLVCYRYRILSVTGNAVKDFFEENLVRLWRST